MNEVVTADRAAATIYNCAEDHRDVWQDRPDWFWYLGLLEEVAELGLALLGWHRHPHPDFDTVDWELRQVGSIAMNWIRKRDRVAGICHRRAAPPAGEGVSTAPLLYSTYEDK
jgi:hypothetical protein